MQMGHGLSRCPNTPCCSCGRVTHVCRLRCLQVVREKQAVEEIRKRAKWIGQHVAVFWSKCQRVVDSKVRLKSGTQ